MDDKRIKELTGEKFNPLGEGKTCEGCIFAYGDTPMDNAPDKCSCTVYPYPKVKPDNVFLEGGHCKYRRDCVIDMNNAGQRFDTSEKRRNGLARSLQVEAH